MVKGLKEYFLRNTIVEIAVAIVLGLAAWELVKAVVGGVVSPLIAVIFGKPNLDAVWNFEVNHAHFSLGVLLTAIIAAIVVVLGLYYLVAVPMGKLARKASDSPEP